MNGEQHPNPYAPPRAPEPAAWPAPAPAVLTRAPRTLGILSIVFASVTLLSSSISSCSGLAAPVMRSMSSRLPNDSADPQNATKAFEVLADIYLGFGLQGLIFLVMSAFLLALGVGQLRYRRWAARGTVLWGSVALAALLGIVAINLLIVGPAYQKIFDLTPGALGPAAQGLPGPWLTELGSAVGLAIGLFSLFFYAPYPIVLLISFTREHIRGAMVR